MSFEEIFQQNERRIHYHIHRLGIRDPFQEFYTEGLYAMWMAYKKYNPNQGPLGTYFNYAIRNRLVDMLRKEVREREKRDIFVEKEKQRMDDAAAELKNMMGEIPGSNMEVSEMLEEVRSRLTEKQWDWVYYYILLDMPLKEIADLKRVSVEAVKSWGKEARRKLREGDTGNHLE
ncbi:sigma-70 family RNA polymerase sigma factor [Oceanobacillus sp. FSL H7-0719]|uniref:sigma-70 family RNA polymerase sigma factor n=1 Tax=Oceanobacillus sp. FSL H7-0719 TaxID=2954507 RepID=UPI00324672B6